FKVRPSDHKSGKGLGLVRKILIKSIFRMARPQNKPEQSVRRTGDTDTEQNQNSRQQASNKASYCNKKHIFSTGK
ncbi:MAG: hypothetical protein IKF90_01865, partial [Parasporobacterium sp.]|nr:hypothetical protein [Parasporobacterium sp.]